MNLAWPVLELTAHQEHRSSSFQLLPTYFGVARKQVWGWVSCGGMRVRAFPWDAGRLAVLPLPSGPRGGCAGSC